MKHVSRLLLPGLLGLALAPARAQQSPWLWSSSGTPSVRQLDAGSVKRIEVSDLQLKQLSALFNGLKWREAGDVSDFRVIPLDGPRPQEAGDAAYYDDARHLRSKEKAPVTDIVVYEKEPLLNAMSVIAGNRSFIIFSAKEFEGESPDMQRRITAFTMAHEFGHLRRKHVHNVLEGLDEKADAVRAIEPYMDWAGAFGTLPETNGIALEVMHREFRRILAEAEIFRDVLAAIPQRAPSQKRPHASSPSFVQSERRINRAQIDQEVKADGDGLRATGDGEAAARGLRDMIARDWITQIAQVYFSMCDAQERSLKAAGRKDMIDAQREYCRQEFERRVEEEMQPETVIRKQDEALQKMDEAGVLDHPYNATRLARYEYWQRHHTRKQPQAHDGAKR